MGATTKGIGGLVPTTIGPVPITLIAECKKMVPQGSMTSPSFRITGKFLTFLIGAGCKDYTVLNIRAELIVNGELVRKETMAACKEAMTEKSWNVTGYAGKNARLRLVDHFSGRWGHINFDHLQACL